MSINKFQQIIKKMNLTTEIYLQTFPKYRNIFYFLFTSYPIDSPIFKFFINA